MRGTQSPKTQSEIPKTQRAISKLEFLLSRERKERKPISPIKKLQPNRHGHIGSSMPRKLLCKSNLYNLARVHETSLCVPRPVTLESNPRSCNSAEDTMRRQAQASTCNNFFLHGRKLPQIYKHYESKPLVFRSCKPVASQPMPVEELARVRLDTCRTGYIPLGSHLPPWRCICSLFEWHTDKYLRSVEANEQKMPKEPSHYRSIPCTPLHWTFLGAPVSRLFFICQRALHFFICGTKPPCNWISNKISKRVPSL